MGNNFRFLRGYTHKGYFHADDVFSSAFLRIMNPAIRFYRVNQVPELSEGDIVFDIGDGVYDHHINPLRRRDNGIPFSSFGLLWDAFAKDFYGSSFVKEYVESHLVEEIDLADNCHEFSALTDYIYALNDRWVLYQYEETQDESFEFAVSVATTILVGMVNKAKVIEHLSLDLYEEFLIEDLSSDTIKAYSCTIPYPDFATPGINYIIFSSARGDWVCYATSEDYYYPKGKRGIRSFNKTSVTSPCFISNFGNMAVFNSAEAAFAYVTGLEKEVQVSLKKKKVKKSKKDKSKKCGG